MNFKPEAIRPLEIQCLETREVLIAWQDGHRSLYANIYLRKNCRCAACIDEWTGEPRLDPQKISPEIHIRQFRPVGNYGVRFDWSDGHATGIYAFDYLRSLCPCPSCAPSKSAT